MLLGLPLLACEEGGVRRGVLGCGAGSEGEGRVVCACLRRGEIIARAETVDTRMEALRGQTKQLTLGRKGGPGLGKRRM